MGVLAQAHQPDGSENVREAVSPVESAQINSTIRENATPIEGGQITGTVNSTNDTDWYSFQARAGENSILLAKSAQAPGLELDLSAPDTNADIADSSDWASAGENDRRAQVGFIGQEAGTYYLRIQPTSATENISNQANNSYTVRVFENATRSAPQPTATGNQQEIEPNDAPLAATSINDTEMTSEIAVQGDTDWYTIQASENETVSILLDKPAGERGLAVKLYTSGVVGRLFVEDEGSVLQGDRRLDLSGSNATMYYVRVSSVDSMDSNIPYVLYRPGSAAPETPTPTATPAATATSTAASTPTSTAPPPSTRTERTPSETRISNDAENAATTGNANGGGGAAGNATGTTDEGGTGAFGPGFGTVGAIIALLAAALFAVRRQ